MKKNNKKKKRLFSRLEGFIYKMGTVIVIALIIGVVCTETSKAKLNVDVQREEKNITNKLKTIDSLEMQIDELTSLDRIKEISKEYGLAYRAEAIKTIE